MKFSNADICFFQKNCYYIWTCVRFLIVVLSILWSSKSSEPSRHLHVDNFSVQNKNHYKVQQSL